MGKKKHKVREEKKGFKAEEQTVNFYSAVKTVTWAWQESSLKY